MPPPPLLPPPAAHEAAFPSPPFHATARQSPASAFSLVRLGPLAPRLAEDVKTVPEGYGRGPAGLGPGAVAGIVLGSVAGFLLLLGLIYACATLGAGARRGAPTTDAGSVTTASVVTRKSRKHRHSSKHHSRSYSRSSSPRRRETLEIRQERVERIVVPGPGPPPPPAPPPMRETERIIVEEHSRSRPPLSPVRVPRGPSPHPLSDDEDEVVVIEEHSPPRRKRRSKERRSNGYQGVDSYRYDEREMGRRRSESRRR